MCRVIDSHEIKITRHLYACVCCAISFGIVNGTALMFIMYIGDLEKVDKSHFHVFQIPDGCINLSSLTRQVIPSYDMESGYGYHEYVEGESFDPNEQILLYNKVKIC